MVFSSSVFMFGFLPIVLAGYFLMPKREAKNTWLFAASLLFYAWGEPVYILLMLFSITANWALALLLEISTSMMRRRIILAFSCILNILVIGFFKYEGFLAENINALAGAPIMTDLNLALPIGISFYTLQALSYVIDVYRKEVSAQRNILYLGMYIACFPQLIAGPIVRYQTIEKQIMNRTESIEKLSSGLRLFIVGLGKKVLLANTVAILADEMLSAGGPAIGIVGAWGGVIAYSFQIYFDFSGYSDMAIGLGRMMGFDYLRNFNYPYISRSITEFWRRWHISLSTFFRDYIYIPLGGSRVSAPRWLVNIAIVWAVTGLWHGAAWNYVLWGIYYGVILIVEKVLLNKVLYKMPRAVCHIYVIAIFVIGWTFFWITDNSILFPYFQAMFGKYGLVGTSTFWQLHIWEYWPIFIICIIASMPLAPWIKEHFIALVENRPSNNILEEGAANPKAIQADSLCIFHLHPASQRRKTFARLALFAYDLFLLTVLTTCIISIVSGSFNPFIYFQF